jgi:beta-hydroxylase
VVIIPGSPRLPAQQEALMSTPLAHTGLSHSRSRRLVKRAAKRIIPLVLAIYFIPGALLVYVVFGLLDFSRNRRRTLESLDRYFAGNGVFTWLLSPFNLLMDLLTLPYRNKGVYRLSDLPAGHQSEINDVIDAARRGDLVGKLSPEMQGKKRGMIFFKWYGKNLETSIDLPEFHKKYKYIRTIGVSVFNRKQSTDKHFGPLRITLRVLYNINDIASRNVFIKVGGHIHYWQDEKLFIFDDTLQHQSCNQSDELRYCMFIDILRPSIVPALMSSILHAVRLATAPFNAVFYRHWSFIK